MCTREEVGHIGKGCSDSTGGIQEGWQTGVSGSRDLPVGHTEPGAAPQGWRDNRPGPSGTRVGTRGRDLPIRSLAAIGKEQVG